MKLNEHSGPAGTEDAPAGAALSTRLIVRGRSRIARYAGKTDAWKDPECPPTTTYQHPSFLDVPKNRQPPERQQGQS